MRFFRKGAPFTFLCLLILSTAIGIFFLRSRWAKTLAGNSPAPVSRMSGFPRLFLWAWERPEHLEFINPKEVGVAFLAETITLRGNNVIRRPRLQKLAVPPGTTLIAVVRIEPAHDEHPGLSVEQRREIVEALVTVAARHKVSALQIDFDATQSERAFYRNLLNDVRHRLPESMPLSITALASWCIFDNWLEGLPVDEAVPMLFDMGIDQHRITEYLNNSGKLRASLCQESIGISTDNALASFSDVSRVYVFNPRPWSELTVRNALERSRNETRIP